MTRSAAASVSPPIAVLMNRRVAELIPALLCRTAHVQTRSRASPFTTTVTTRSRRPISTSADTYRSDVASVNSLASTLAIV